MLKGPTSMKGDTLQEKFTAISDQVSPVSIRDVCAGNCHRTLVDESGMDTIQIGTCNRSEIVAEHGTPCVIPPRNGNCSFS